MTISLRRLAVRCLTLVAVAGVPPLATATAVFEAEVRVTSYGIPHIKANDWAGLGYGYGYHYASHNLCILAREVVAANGQLARYFGDSGRNVDSDLFYTLVNTDERVQEFADIINPNALEGIRGYAAGYSRYLADTGVSNLPEDCRDAEWVRPIDETDMLRVFYKLILRGSAGDSLLFPLIVSAAPPATNAVNKGTLTSIESARSQLARIDKSAFDAFREPKELGSNMYALGANATQNGRGMVLGNPHFPWRGPLRWYEVHLTIPGEVNVMGASLQGVPLVNIGFTEDFAWSHTVSPAWRFNLFELALVPGDPTSYFYDGEPTAMTTHDVTIEVLEGDGTITTRDHRFYRSVHGWVLDFAPFFGFPFWNTGIGVFALGDANEENLRAIDQFFLMNTSDNFDEFKTALKDTVGLPWVHTIAADSNGDAFYGDISVVPNISDAKLDDCPPLSFGSAIVDLAGIYVLDGSRSECEWDDDPSAPAAGIIGKDNLPILETRDYATNSNDNHWVANPDMPLEGFAPLFTSEQSARSLRTRLGLKQVQERLAGTDGLGAPGYNLDTVQENLFGSRNYLAELIVDDLVVLCQDEGPTVDIGGGQIVDVSEACTILGNWDKRHNVESVGPHVFLEFLEAAFDELDDNLLLGLYEVPFDVNDPVNTPRELADTEPADRADLMRWLGVGVQRLADNGIPLNAQWGDIHFEEKNGVRYPIHGGRDGTGMFSIITTSLESNLGYTPVDHGNSYMQTVTWDDDGNVVADALLSYSQSSDPVSDNYTDQTALYSTKDWVRLPFYEEDILADPNYQTFTISEPRVVDAHHDGIDDKVDNCTLASNPDQTDTDNDGYGNRCDGDFNQDDVVNFADLAYMKQVFMTNDALADLNSDGDVNFEDLSILKSLFFAPPGPGNGAPQTRYSDVQPFLEAKCGPCHLGSAVSGFTFASSYEGALMPAQHPDCTGESAGECALTRVRSGAMPFAAGCTGEPLFDSGNPSCLTQTEQSLLEAWINGGLIE